jgi:hypothetical protein
VTVAAGAPTDVAFRVTCAPLGTIQVTVATTGTGAPATYMVKATEILLHLSHTAFVPSNGTISFPTLMPGSYAVQLTVPPNCTLPAHTPNPVTVTVSSGATTTIVRSVTCGPPATLRVTVATTGPQAPASFTVGVDPDPFSGIYRYRAVISSNGTVSQVLPPGQHMVDLRIPPNCTVPTNSVSVTLAPGTTTDLGFSVACQ